VSHATDYLQFIVLGLGAGALYAALAQGLVLAHRGAGVINVAHGAMAMYVAYVYAGVREGRLLVPPIPNPLSLISWIASLFGYSLSLPGIPPFLDLGGDPGVVTSLGVAVAMAIVLGLAVHLLVFRPLRSAPPLAKTVAAVGVMLTLQAIVVLRFGSQNLAVPPLLPRTVLRTAGIVVPVNRLFLAAFALVVAALLWAFFRFTVVGIATRAAAENERGATLIGLSVDRLAALSWCLSSVVAGLAGILFSSLTGLNPNDFVLYVIPAMGAALLARLESFPLAALGGLLIGVLESVTLPLKGDLAWLPKTGAGAGIPFLVIFVAMIITGKRLPTRATLAEMRLPAFNEPRNQVRFLLIVVALAVAGLLLLPFDFRGAEINSLAAVLAALSFVVVVGMAGQLSLMQLTIAGMAALAMTRLAGDMHMPFPLSALLAVAVATVSGVVAGLPALRVRGVHLAVLTLGAAYAFDRLVLANGDYLRTSDVSGSVPPPAIFGYVIDINAAVPIGTGGSPNAAFGFFELVLVLLACALVLWLRRSVLGLQMLAVRSNERAAAGMGIDVARTKVAAFAIGAVLAGLSGVVSAYRFGGVTADQYSALASVGAIASAYLGGISSIGGALIAGVLGIEGLGPRLLDRVFLIGRYQPLIAGVGLILTALLNPEGIAGVFRDLADRGRARLGEFRSRRTAGP
jgi:branched-subunit amino acid ABC-type transport system permease component